MSEIILTIEGVDPLELYGQSNSRLNLIKNAFPDVSINTRGNNLKLSGEKKFTQKVKEKFEQMVRLLKENKELTDDNVKGLLAGDNPFKVRLSANSSDNKTIVHGLGGKVIKAKTPNQKMLVHAAENNDVVFAIGPAGTGKTYTAVALAVQALRQRVVKKIIITRPAVEAGENLGFLPGDLKDKIDPYLRPLYDALEDMIEPDKLTKFMENRTIEIAPLAFMRGRTLDNAFIILDEAQNCTTMQIKMFLTRLGPSAKCVITGDLSQVDLPYNQVSGLRRAAEVLNAIQGIATIHLSPDDVVRHRLVKDIILAYEKADAEEQQRFEEYREQERQDRMKAREVSKGEEK